MFTLVQNNSQEKTYQIFFREVSNPVPSIQKDNLCDSELDEYDAVNVT